CVDPISGRRVVIAPGRAHRPGAGFALIEPETQQELDECPFCRGREDRTPPETRRLPEGATQWTVRVVPNLYPAVEGHEVIVHSPDHGRTFAELTDDEVGFVADIVSSTDAFWLVNEGRAAGSSLPHSHSQLVSVEPPVENAVGVREVLALDELLVTERDGVRAVAHPAGRLPYELLIRAELIQLALLLLRACISRLRR